MEKKYKLTEETIEFYGRTLHRIEALKSFVNVSAGEKGGYIEKEENLSQEGESWVYGNAKVFDNANVCDNAKVYGNTEVFDNAEVCDNAKVYGNAKVWGYAEIWCYAKVYGNAKVFDNANVCDNAKVYGNARVCGNAEVCGNAKVCGNAEVCGDAEVCGNAEVQSNNDYIVFKNHFSSGRYFTYTASNKMWKVGCFYGNGEELIAKAKKYSKEKAMYYEAYVNFVKQLESLDAKYFYKEK